MLAGKINPFEKPLPGIRLTEDATERKQLTTKPYSRTEPGSTACALWNLLIFSFQTISHLKNDFSGTDLKHLDL